MHGNVLEPTCFSPTAQSWKDQGVGVAKMKTAALLYGGQRKPLMGVPVPRTCILIWESSPDWILVQDYIFSTAKEKKHVMVC